MSKNKKYNHPHMTDKEIDQYFEQLISDVKSSLESDEFTEIPSHIKNSDDFIKWARSLNS